MLFPLRLIYLPLLALSVCSAAHATKLTLLTTEIPGLAHTGPEGASGLLIEAIKKATARAGIANQMETVPWPRAILMAEQNPDTCVVGLRQTADNKSSFQWLGPIGRQRHVLYALNTYPENRLNSQQLAGKTAGILRGGLLASEATTLGLQIEPGRDIETNFRKLLAHRYDFVLAGELEVQQYLKSTVPPLPVKIVYSFAPINHYLACHPATALETLRRFAAAIRDLTKEGALRELGVPAN